MVVCTSVVVTPPEPGRGSCACRIFPLCFTRQSIGAVTWRRGFPARFTVKPGNISLRILPAHAHDRIALGLTETRILPTHVWLLVPLETIETTPISRW